MSLAGLKQFREQEERQGGAASYLRLKDGEKVKIHPLQELDPSSPNFSEKNGHAVFTKEWHNPEDFKKQIVDLSAEGQACVGPELLKQYGWDGDQNGGRGKPDAWRPKKFLYMNVLVQRAGAEPEVALVKWNMAPKATQANTLLAVYEDEDNDQTVANRWYTYSRKGADQFDTTYTLTPGDKSDIDVEAYDLIDIESVLPVYDYDRQRAVLGLNGPRTEASVSGGSAGESSSDDTGMDAGW